MCGIFGLIDNKTSINRTLFVDSLLKIKHRGPDHSGYNFINENIALGHVRLSIIDLNPNSNQPFQIDENYYLTYNGEIFNYLEIKEKLIDLGHKFITDGDTEVLLRSYIQWEKKCVNKFNGMWSFVIFDKKKNTFFCSRDRYGIKPFYYYYDNDKFIFASEIKSIINYFEELNKPDFQSLYGYLYLNRGGESSYTWFDGIKRLQPAHNLTLKNYKKKIFRYWNYPKKKHKVSFQEAKSIFYKKISNSIKIRLRSDVPVSTTLTSGIDSNVISAFASKYNEKKINSYTIYNNEERYLQSDRNFFNQDVNLNESTLLKKNRDFYNLEQHLYELNDNNFYKKLKKCIYHLDSGHSSTAVVSLLQLYEKVKIKNKVLLEGQGADELLGGYITDMVPIQIIELLRKFKFLKLINFIMQVKNVYSFRFIFLSFMNSFSQNKLVNYLKIKILRTDIVNSIKFERWNNFSSSDKLIQKHNTGLVNLLQYGDALSMSCGIETRLPFMDKNLVEFCFSLPFNFKVKDLNGKFILREASKKIIPKDIYESKVKIGFSTPIEYLIKNEKKIKTILYTDYNIQLINQKKLNKILDKFYKNKFNQIGFIYRVLSIKLWFKIFNPK